MPFMYALYTRKKIESGIMFLQFRKNGNWLLQCVCIDVVIKKLFPESSSKKNVRQNLQLF